MACHIHARKPGRHEHTRCNDRANGKASDSKDPVPACASRAHPGSHTNQKSSDYQYWDAYIDFDRINARSELTNHERTRNQAYNKS